MTTNTQNATETGTKKPASPVKPKKARATKRTTPKPGNRPTRPKKTTARPKTKQAIIRGLLERPDGASIAELTRATKWQAHSVRAALTGLRKAGAEIVRTRDEGGTTRYQIAADGPKQAVRTVPKQ